MSDPRCPTCRSELTLKHAVQMPNPWDYRCPECATELEAGSSHKVLAVASPLLTTGIVGMALALKQAQVLAPAASFTFMLACALTVLAGQAWAWQRTTFTRKARTARR